MAKVKKTIAVKVVLETSYFTLYSDGKMAGKEEALNELASEIEEGTPFWEALNEEVFEAQCNDDFFYTEESGNNMPFVIGGTSAPAFFIGCNFKDDFEKTKFRKIYMYEPYALHFWQDILLKNGEVWFDKVK
jgi:hypothetical protein